MMRRPGISVESGFTVVELVMVMLVVGILVAIGVPSFKYVTASNRIASEINALLGDMRYARTEAIKEGLPVTVCASANGTTCSLSSASWQSGWIIFQDPNSTQTATAATLLRVQPAFSAVFNSSTDQFVVTNGIYAVTFNRQGFGASVPAIAANATVTMALRATPENTNWTRCLAITSVGLLTIQRAGTSSCT